MTVESRQVPLLRQIRVSHVQGDEYAIRLRGHELHTDQPDSDRGMTPVELFMASLATCVAHYAGGYLARHHLSRDGLTVLTEYGMATDRPARVARVRLTVRTSHYLTPQRKAALRAVVEHCTVHNSLRQPPEVEIRVDEEENHDQQD